MRRRDREVSDLVGLFRSEEPTESHSWIVGAEHTLAAQIIDVRGRCAASCCSHMKEIALAQEQVAKLCAADSNSVLKHRLEYRLELPRR